MASFCLYNGLGKRKLARIFDLIESLLQVDKLVQLERCLGVIVLHLDFNAIGLCPLNDLHF